MKKISFHFLIQLFLKMEVSQTRICVYVKVYLFNFLFSDEKKSGKDVFVYIVFDHKIVKAWKVLYPFFLPGGVTTAHSNSLVHSIGKN